MAAPVPPFTERHEPAIRGAKIGALAITEPDAGSDVAAVRTRAERVDGGWLVNGAKTYITNGVRADFYVTAVKTREDGGHGGLSFLVLERGEGVRASKREKLGWHASDTGELAFDAPRLAGRGQAARHAFAALATRAEAGAALTHQALRRFLDGGDAVREVTMAKLATQRANFECQDALLGLLGPDPELERAARDARLGPIGGGSDEIMKEILGRSMGL